MDNFTNNGATPPRSESTSRQDSGHGQAAMLLVESLMHTLLEKGIISREEFIEIVEGAAEVEQDLVSAQACSPSDTEGSLLNPLAAAFRQEIGR